MDKTPVKQWLLPIKCLKQLKLGCILSAHGGICVHMDFLFYLSTVSGTIPEKFLCSFFFPVEKLHCNWFQLHLMLWSLREKRVFSTIMQEEIFMPSCRQQEKALVISSSAWALVSSHSTNTLTGHLETLKVWDCKVKGVCVCVLHVTADLFRVYSCCNLTDCWDRLQYPPSYWWLNEESDCFWCLFYENVSVFDVYFNVSLTFHIHILLSSSTACSISACDHILFLVFDSQL